MKFSLFIALFFLSVSAVAQVDSTGLKEAMLRLDKALLEKDTAALRLVLHKDVSYGHSNGWVQTKKNILDDLVSGKLLYTKIETRDLALLAINKKWATAKMITNAEGAVSGTAFNLKLHVMQVWIRLKKGWQLMARQSTKI